MLTSLRVNKTKRICLDALMIATAMLLSYLESVIPLQVLIPLPGIRLGLANLAVVLVFVLISPVDAAIVSALRILAMGVLFGSVTSLYFSAMGGLLSFLMLLLLRGVRGKISFLGASVLCAAAHNTGQILAAASLFGGVLIVTYLPVLLLASVLCGGLVGLLLNLLAPRLARIVGEGDE